MLKIFPKEAIKIYLFSFCIFPLLNSFSFADESPTSAQISIAPFKDNKICAFSFTFDDGEKTVATHILPLFDEFGYKATLFINPATAPEIPHEEDARISWVEIKDAISRGYEIGNHGLTHANLVLNPTMAQTEINNAYQLIKEKTGVAPVSFAFPDDAFNEDLIKKVSKNHYAIRIQERLKEVYPKLQHAVYGGRKFSAEEAKGIVDHALSENEWIIAELHAIKSKRLSYKPIREELLREHLSYIKQNEDKIWVDTFFHVYSYLFEKKNTEIKIKKSSSRDIQFLLDSPLDEQIFSTPLTIELKTPQGHPEKVAAQYHGEKKPIPVIIKGNEIYLEVIPTKKIIEVRWK